MENTMENMIIKKKQKSKHYFEFNSIFPKEIIYTILSFLKIIDLQNLSKTDKYFNNLIKELDISVIVCAFGKLVGSLIIQQILGKETANNRLLKSFQKVPRNQFNDLVILKGSDNFPKLNICYIPDNDLYFFFWKFCSMTSSSPAKTLLIIKDDKTRLFLCSYSSETMMKKKLGDILIRKNKNQKIFSYSYSHSLKSFASEIEKGEINIKVEYLKEFQIYF